MGLERLVRLVKKKWIWVYLGLVCFGGGVLVYGFLSILSSISFLGLPPYHSNFLAGVDELFIVIGAVLLALGLFLLKKNWSKF